jgi:MraZ protein
MGADETGSRSEWRAARDMALFTGTYENKVDRKGRVSLPSIFRAQLPEGAGRVVYVYRSPSLPALEACDQAFMDRLADSLESFEMFSEEEEDLGGVILADARPLSLDAEGRIMIPPEHTVFAGIEERATFVGRGRRFQIWHPETYGDHAAASRARAKGRTLKLRRSDPES